MKKEREMNEMQGSNLHYGGDSDDKRVLGSESYAGINHKQQKISGFLDKPVNQVMSIDDDEELN